MGIENKLMAMFMAALIEQRAAASQFAAANPGYSRRTRIKGKPGKAGAKLARKAREGRITLRHPGYVVEVATNGR